MKLDTRVLRVIGQDLEDLELHELSLEREGDILMARGLALRKPGQPGERPQQGNRPKSFFRRLFSRGPASLAEPVPKPLERSYSSAEIDRLDEAAKTLRRDSQGVPDLYSVGQILRVIGEYVEDKGGELISLTKKRREVRFRYETTSGEQKAEDRLISDLYDFATHMSMNRQDRS
jgi:hypothetical protein